MVLALTLAAIGTATASAQESPRGILDANNLDGTPTTTTQGSLQQFLWYGQTFIAHRTGLLVSAQATLFRFAIGDPPLLPFAMEIRLIDSQGAPTGPPLASTTLPASVVTGVGPNPGSLVTGNFDSPAQVIAGQRYALVLSTRSSLNYAVTFDEGTGAGYPDGTVWFQFDPLGQFGPPGPWFDIGSDMIFATYVAPEEVCGNGIDDDLDGLIDEGCNQPPDCLAATAAPRDVWPPDARLVPVTITGVADPDGDSVQLAITTIRQDEPTKGSGPDGIGVGTSTPLVRAERADGGDGRTYHIGFQASDGRGGSCSGVVKVNVPHDRGRGSIAVDGGPLYDSTVS